MCLSYKLLVQIKSEVRSVINLSLCTAYTPMNAKGPPYWTSIDQIWFGWLFWAGHVRVCWPCSVHLALWWSMCLTVSVPRTESGSTAVPQRTKLSKIPGSNLIWYSLLISWIHPESLVFSRITKRASWWIIMSRCECVSVVPCDGLHLQCAPLFPVFMLLSASTIGVKHW